MRVRVPWQKPHPFRNQITEWEIDLTRSALLLMDFQAAYVQPDVGMGLRLKNRLPLTHTEYYSRLRDIVIPNAVRLLQTFRNLGLPVVFTRLGTLLTNGRDLPSWSWRSALQRAAGDETPFLYPVGAPEHDTIPELPRTAEDLVIDRPTFSPFHASPLDQYLRNMGVENLVVAGMLGEATVEMTAVGSAERNYIVLIADDACAGLMPASMFRYLSACVTRPTDYLVSLFAQLAPP